MFKEVFLFLQGSQSITDSVTFSVIAYPKNATSDIIVKKIRPNIKKQKKTIQRKLYLSPYPHLKKYNDCKKDPPCEILPNLWLGNYSHSVVSNDYDFTKIVNIGVVTRKQVTDALYFNVVDENGSDISKYFHKICDKIHTYLNNNEKVYLHCFWGWSRSPTILAAYLIKYHDMSTTEAILFIQRKRNIRPKDSFINDLLALEFSLKTGLDIKIE